MKFKVGDVCIIKKVDCERLSNGILIDPDHRATILLNVGKVVRIKFVEHDEFCAQEELPYCVMAVDESKFEYYFGELYDDLWLPEDALEIVREYASFDAVDPEEFKIETSVLL